MDIMLEIISRQKFLPDVSVNVVFGEAGGIIGRSKECDWVLPDKSKQVSRKHAIITCYNSTFHIEDVSTNGIFHSLGRTQLPANTPVPINHGDGFIIGEYTISARLMQSADSYVGEGAVTETLFADKALSLNPLAAMDEEEEREAGARLGNFNDLLGRNIVEPLVPADHAEAQISSMPRVTTVPDTSLAQYDPWNAQNSLSGASPASKASNPHPPLAEALTQPEVPEIKNDSAPVPVSVPVPETDIFFQMLGYNVPPDMPEERERILRTAAELLFVAVENIVQTMQNRAECKNELRLSLTTTSLTISNNPFKFSPTAMAAVATLLGPAQKGIMEPVEAMKAAFNDNHSHHMGLLAGARAVAGAALRKISPGAVEATLDINGPARFARTRRLWHTFIKMHHAQMHDHEGFEALFLQDFARAYEMQCRTLNPAAYRKQKGDRE